MSATNVAKSATTVTVPAGSYYLTATTGTSSLLTTLQTQLNDNVQGYPTTAAAAAAAAGAGTWSSGWLMNESSGNLIDAFGASNLAVSVGTAVYGITGPRSGVDKAIGFDTATDRFSGGDILDANGDLVFAWVAKFTQNGANGDFLGKGWGTAAGGEVQYLIARESNGVSFYLKNSAGSTHLSTCSGHVGDWHVGVAALDRIAGKMRAATMSLSTLTQSLGTNVTISLPTTGNAQNFLVGDAGAYTADLNLQVAALYAGAAATGIPDNIATALTKFGNAVLASWAVSIDTSGGTGRVSIGWTGYTTPTWSLSWTSTELRDRLGFTANISSVTTTQTGAEQAEAVWFPDCPLNLDGDPDQAPKVTDLRSTISPTGAVISLVGNAMYRHRGVLWSHVPKNRAWESAVTYANASWEYFANECILGLGSSWFTPSSELQIYYDSNGTQKAVGNTYNSNAGVSGWQTLNLSSVEPKQAIAQYTGLWKIELGDIVSDG